MSDSKKRSHDRSETLAEDPLSADEPLAKKPKIVEEAPAASNLRSSNPLSAQNASSTSPGNTTPVFAGFTDPGSRYGTLNQDCYFMERLRAFNGAYVTVIAVFDGHGKHGETASRLACDYFQSNLRAHLTQPKPVSSREHEKSMRNIFEGAHKRILAEYEKLTTLNFDGYTFSLTMTADRVDFYQSSNCPYVLLQDFGTTAVVCVYWEETQKLLVANCGDSDALIGRWDSAAKTVQPNLLTISDNVSCMSPGEQERIKRDFGRKTKFGGGYLSPNDATYGFHSLAMTRALGHKFLEKYGVAWDPHIRQFQITPEDLVLVVGSDGLFDVVNNKAILSLAAERQPSSYLFPPSSPSSPPPIPSARSPVPSASIPTLPTEASSSAAAAGNGNLQANSNATSTSDQFARVLTPTESSERLVHLALSNWKRQFSSPEVADNTTVCVMKLSSEFDEVVPVRTIDLHNSGTPFSPASVALHAFEAEIEETSKDHIIIDGNSSSTPTPKAPASPPSSPASKSAAVRASASSSTSPSASAMDVSPPTFSSSDNSSASGDSAETDGLQNDAATTVNSALLAGHQQTTRTPHEPASPPSQHATTNNSAAAASHDHPPTSASIQEPSASPSVPSISLSFADSPPNTEPTVLSSFPRALDHKHPATTSSNGENGSASIDSSDSALSHDLAPSHASSTPQTSPMTSISSRDTANLESTSSTALEGSSS